jgi:hypothetical protein
METALAKKDIPKLSFQFFPLKLSAEGIEAVRPLAWPAGAVLVALAILLLR